MMKRPEPQDVIAMARVVGVTVDHEIAARIIRSIGPALEGFAPVAGTLPFDLEPASFVVAQLKGSQS